MENNQKFQKTLLKNISENFELDIMATIKEEDFSTVYIIMENMRNVSEHETPLIRNQYKCDSTEELKEKAEIIINKYQTAINNFKNIVNNI